MPLKASDLARERRRTVVSTAIGDCWVIYRPHELTPAREEMISEALQRDDAGSGPMLSMLQDLVIDWDMEGPLIAKVDVEDESTDWEDLPEGSDGLKYRKGDEIVPEGTKVQPIPEHTAHLSSAFISAVFKAVREDMDGDPKPRRGSSDGGSFRKVR